MRQPTPQQLGFPEKFSSWRPNQVDAMERLRTSTKRVRVVDSPVGSGKSGIYLGHIIETGLVTAVVTESLGLMHQLHRDAKGMGAVTLMGRARYKCSLKPEYTCDDGRHARCPMHGSHRCPLSAAEAAAATSRIIITNYDKLTSTGRLGPFKHIEQIVFDEGHLAPEALARAVQVLLHDHEIEKILQVNYPRHEEMVDWKQWAVRTRDICEAKLKDAQRDILIPEPKVTHVKLFNHLTNLKRRLTVIACCQPHDWIVDRTDRGYQFDPIRVGRYAESKLFLRVPRIIITSATLRPKILWDLGIATKDFDYWDYLSDFDPKDCPFYYIPTQKVDKNNTDLSALWVRHDQAAGRRRDRKSIVHPVSYVRAGEIHGYSRFADSMLLHEKGKSTDDLVSVFRESGPGTILVSPAVGAGYDFPKRDCEWQFICKVPFPDSRSKIVSARQEMDPEYGVAQAARVIQQIAGRGARSRGDRCENFIADDNFEWLYRRYHYLFSKSFHQFYKRIDTLPPPPPRL